MPKILPRLLAGGALITALGLTTANASAPASPQLYPVSDSAANLEIEEIRKAYRHLFQQESVLRADSRDLVSF